MVEIYGERGAGGGRGNGGPGGRGYGRLPQPNLADLAALLDRSEETVQAAIALFPDINAMVEALEIEDDQLIEALGVPEGFRPPAGADRGGAGQDGVGRPGGGPRQRNPIWAPVTVEFAGQTWWQVGFRYKGNTALSMSWGINATALPFKLDFDEFEDANPELDNQRFYGFKQLGFGNNFGDPSLQREKVAADVFRAAGVPAAETAFYAVYVDNGNGEGFQPWGFYTAVELPDDTLIETQFADDDGNMYKPSGGGATFAADSFTEESFPKRTNRQSEFADVQALSDVLHAETRLSNPVAWREELEAVFDVERFLRWLATNRFVQKRDTYGTMAKDFYLYADSASGQLVWIPWDNN
ncbi:MAG: CotH kinase family protein [Anaerolineae bacterium]|nr:CotH kinase family protein [Anaerolineae bacterium]